jgi:hypothetical protein
VRGQPPTVDIHQPANGEPTLYDGTISIPRRPASDDPRTL